MGENLGVNFLHINYPLVLIKIRRPNLFESIPLSQKASLLKPCVKMRSLLLNIYIERIIVNGDSVNVTVLVCSLSLM